MKSSWLKGARTEEERKRREVEFQTALPALAVLEKYLEDRIQEIQRTRDDDSFQSEFQFSQNQARAAGYIAAYRKVLSHIKHDNHEPETKGGE